MQPSPGEGCGEAPAPKLAVSSSGESLAAPGPKWNASEFQCSICYELLLDPVVGSCGHDFCKHCIEEWRTSRQLIAVKCPICRAALLPSADQTFGICIRLRETIEKLFPEQVSLRRRQVAQATHARKCLEDASLQHPSSSVTTLSTSTVASSSTTTSVAPDVSPSYSSGGRPGGPAARGEDVDMEDAAPAHPDAAAGADSSTVSPFSLDLGMLHQAMEQYRELSNLVSAITSVPAPAPSVVQAFTQAAASMADQVAYEQSALAAAAAAQQQQQQQLAGAGARQGGVGGVGGGAGAGAEGLLLRQRQEQQAAAIARLFLSSGAALGAAAAMPPSAAAAAAAAAALQQQQQQQHQYASMLYSRPGSEHSDTSSAGMGTAGSSGSAGSSGLGASDGAAAAAAAMGSPADGNSGSFVAAARAAEAAQDAQGTLAVSLAQQLAAGGAPTGGGGEAYRGGGAVAASSFLEAALTLLTSAAATSSAAGQLHTLVSALQHQAAMGGDVSGAHGSVGDPRAAVAAAEAGDALRSTANTMQQLTAETAALNSLLRYHHQQQLQAHMAAQAQAQAVAAAHAQAQLLQLHGQAQQAHYLQSYLLSQAAAAAAAQQHQQPQQPGGGAGAGGAYPAALRPLLQPQPVPTAAQQQQLAQQQQAMLGWSLPSLGPGLPAMGAFVQPGLGLLYQHAVSGFQQAGPQGYLVRSGAVLHQAANGGPGGAATVVQVMPVGGAVGMGGGGPGGLLHPGSLLGGLGAVAGGGGAGLPGAVPPHAPGGQAAAGMGGGGAAAAAAGAGGGANVTAQVAGAAAAGAWPARQQHSPVADCSQRSRAAAAAAPSPAAAPTGAVPPAVGPGGVQGPVGYHTLMRMSSSHLGAPHSPGGPAPGGLPLPHPNQLHPAAQHMLP